MAHYKTFIVLILLFLSLSSISVIDSDIEVVKPVWNSFNGFKKLLIYYGWLSTSNVLDLDIDVLVIPGALRTLPGGDDRVYIDQLLDNGVEVYAYLHDNNDDPVGLGTSFREIVVENISGTIETRYSYWLGYIESIIDRYAGLFTGVFLDECDPNYFTDDLGNIYVEWFTWGVGNLTRYAHSRGLKVFINGVMGYAGYGDYYLWEDFVTSYDFDHNEYVYLDDFLVNKSYSSPYEWVNGYPRYEYLLKHGLLNHTFAVSFADQSDPRTIKWVEIGYALARIMGLAGWGYADINFYSSGGAVSLNTPIYEYGIPLSEPVFNIVEETASRIFSSAGKVYVDVSKQIVEQEYVFETEPLIDGVRENVYESILNKTLSGTYTSIYKASIVAMDNKFYLYTVFSTSSSGGLLHIYVDIDNDYSTGYLLTINSREIGVDYMVEIYTDGSARLFQYSGSGSDWSWEQLSMPPIYFNKTLTSYIVEIVVELPVDIVVNKTSIVLAPIYNWGDDLYTEPYIVRDKIVLQPHFYSKPTMYSPIITLYRLQDNKVVVEGVAGKGVLVNYTFYIPFTEISNLTINGEPVPKLPSRDMDGQGYSIVIYGDYAKITVLARHHSRVVIIVTGPHYVESTTTIAPLPMDEPVLFIMVSLFASILLATVIVSMKK